MKKTIEQIRQEAELAKKTLKKKEDRAMLKFAKAVLQSASSNGAQLDESEILRVVSEAARQSLGVKTPFISPDPDLHL